MSTNAGQFQAAGLAEDAASLESSPSQLVEQAEELVAVIEFHAARVVENPEAILDRLMTARNA